MHETTWVEVKDGPRAGDMVGFESQCRRGAIAKCGKYAAPHGHVQIACDDGIGHIPFPCASFEGVSALLLYLTEHERLTTEEAAAVLNIPDVRALPMELRPHEDAIIADAEEIDRLTRYGFAGAGR